MGSIEVFPRKPGAHTIADVWRVAPVPGSGLLRAREMRLEDYAAVRALQRDAHPAIPSCGIRQLESRLQTFPEGQLVAEANGVIVGAASSLVVQWDDYAVDHTWKDITGDGAFTTHDPEGATLYGAEHVVDVTRRGFGVSRVLNQAQRRLCRRRNLRRIICAARLPGYRAVKDAMSPELYAMRVIWGDIPDPALRFQMSQGYHYCGIIHDYQPEDVASCGHAALLVWLNPLYSPPRPPALAEPREPQRKSA